MKNKFLFLVIAISFLFAESQAQTFTQIFDSVFTHVSRTDATTGILYERVLPFGNLTHYNSLEENPDTSNYSHFLRAYNELYRATFQPSITMMPKDTLKQLVENDTTRVQIGMLHFYFNTFDTTVFRDKLYFDNDSVLWEDTFNTNSLYKENMLFVASPLTKVLTTLNASFTVNSLFYFDNTRELFRNVSIDFDDGLGFRLVSLNEVVRVNYLQDGIKTIKFKVTLRNGNILLAYAIMEVKAETPEGERYSGPLFYDDFYDSNAIKAKINLTNPYDGGYFQKLKGEIRVYYANSDKLLRKPLLIIDGFDPLDERKFDTNLSVGQKSLWEMLFYDDDYGQHLHLGLRLLDMGYDVVLLNLPNGGAYIEENALVCIEVINQLNEMLLQNNSDEQIVVVGPSMGGQVARYALTYMEQNPNANTNFGKHNTRLWISYDSPHQGANIAMGAQALIEHFADEDDSEGASLIWNYKLCCNAALQMLIHHRKDTLQQMYNAYYSQLQNLNTQTNGYPSNTRNIAIANGSLNNVTCGIPYQISYEGLVTFGLGSYDLRTRNVVNSGAGNVFDYTIWILFVPIHKEIVFNNNSGNTSPDIAPGCLYNTFDQIVAAVKDVTKGFAITVHNIKNHCFMPITSTLDIQGDMDYCTNISNRDLVGEGLTPFDSYNGVMDSNMYHVTFNQHLVDYMFNEIETYLQGPREVQLCQTPRPTYTLHLPHDSILTDVTWLCSDNIRIIRTSDPTVVNIVALSVGDGWISAEVPTLKHRKRLANYPIHVSVNENNNLPVISTSDIPQQTMTISSEVLLPDTFCVENGKTLTITSSGILHCSPGTRLIVRPGGKLVVDGGTITSACDGEMWQGIEVVGDRNKQQLSQYQGTVELKNGAVIENALCAIRTGLRGDTNFATAGGIIYASDATFRNNCRAVEINSYRYPLSGTVLNYFAWFTRCSFTVDSNNLFTANDTTLTEHVRLWDVKGVLFEGCSFSDSTNIQAPVGRGIYAHDAGFQVNTYCQPQVTYECECPEAAATYSSLFGFTTAIEVNTDGNPYAVEIDQARLSNNVKGVSINANNYATITRCIFTMTSPIARYLTGLELNNCHGYKVEGNTFLGSTNLTSTYTTGVLVNNNGKVSTDIYRDTLWNLTYGVRATGSNFGVKVLCNDFYKGGADIYVSSGSSLALSQGSLQSSAGNRFQLANGYNIQNAGSYAINYYYSGMSFPNNEYYPYLYSSNVVLTPTKNVNTCPSTLCGTNGGNPSELLTGFQSGITTYTSAAGNDNMDGDAVADTIGMFLHQLYETLCNEYNVAVRTLLSDSLLDLGALEQWHTLAQPVADPYSLTETRFMEGYAEPFVASSDDAELANYAEFHAMKLALRGDNEGDNDGNQDNHNVPFDNSPMINWYALTPAQIAQLQVIAERNTGRASVMAKGVLCFFFGICYDDEWDNASVCDTPLQNDDTTETLTKRAATDISDDAALTVYPNPSDNLLHIELSGAEIRSMVLYDLQGRVVETGRAPSLQGGTATLNLRNVPAGMYLLRVTDSDGKEYERKVVRN